MKTKIKEGS